MIASAELTEVECICCGFYLEEWELEYSQVYCTICPGLPGFIPFEEWEE